MKIGFDSQALEKYGIYVCVFMGALKNQKNNNRLYSINNKELEQVAAYCYSSTECLLDKCMKLRLIEYKDDNWDFTELAYKEIFFENSEETLNKEIEEFFDNLWKCYPIKRGKGQVSFAKKIKLFNIGEETIKKCIERYIKYINENNKQKFIMNGSTFFNSGYVDYLDENYNNEIENNNKLSFLEKVGL